MEKNDRLQTGFLPKWLAPTGQNYQHLSRDSVGFQPCPQTKSPEGGATNTAADIQMRAEYNCCSRSCGSVSSRSDCVVGRELMRLIGNDGLRRFQSEKTVSNNASFLLHLQKVIPAYLIRWRSVPLTWNECGERVREGESHVVNDVKDQRCGNRNNAKETIVEQKHLLDPEYLEQSKIGLSPPPPHLTRFKRSVQTTPEERKGKERKGKERKGKERKGKGVECVGVVWVPTLASCCSSDTTNLKWFINFEEPNLYFDVIVEPEGTVRLRVGQGWAY
ncbi:hypothetical protein Q8A73_009253 [Channa argus]|nr:hypothetical protein Q8A73_009253 [Channa argus]